MKNLKLIALGLALVFTVASEFNAKKRNSYWFNSLGILKAGPTDAATEIDRLINQESYQPTLNTSANYPTAGTLIENGFDINDAENGIIQEQIFQH